MKYRHVGGEHGCNYRWRGHLPEPPLGEFLSSVPSFPSDRLRYAPRAPGAAVPPRGSPAAKDGTPAPPPPQRRPGGPGMRQGGSGVCTARTAPAAPPARLPVLKAGTGRAQMREARQIVLSNTGVKAAGGERGDGGDDGEGNKERRKRENLA